MSSVLRNLLSLLILSFSISFHGDGFLCGASISQTCSYPEFCQLAAEDDNVFANFKQNPIYRQILEHISYEMGLQYLEVIKKEYPEIIPYFDLCRQNDAIGNPITYNFGDAGTFSPTTLRYIKVASELKSKFGDLSKMHIVEIGGGYGGQCMILEALGGFASYTLIDLPQCNALSRKYLERQGVGNVCFIDNDQLTQIQQYDLVISNYAFSEIDQAEQLNYIERIIKPTPRGYVTMNFISHYFNLQSLSLEELISILFKYGHQGKVEKERPVSHPDNLLLTWIHPSLLSSHSNRYPQPPPPLIPSKEPQQGNAVAYSFSGGRFGDNMVAYLHAKWISYKYGLPLLYIPFPYSDQFCLHDLEQPLNDSFSFQNRPTIHDEAEITTKPSSTLYTIPYFPECTFEYQTQNLSWLPYFKVDWEDPGFQAEVRKSLTLKKPVNTLKLPKNRVTVGVHVRRVDHTEHSTYPLVWPLKFPPDNYYIEQIQRVAKIFDNRKLFVYIITNDTDPLSIVQKYKKAINNPNIKFACRINNRAEASFLEDFFSIPKFDCFILCQSNFSITASKLGRYSLLVTPLHCISDGTQVKVDEVELTFKGKN